MSVRENFYFVMGVKLTEEQRKLIPDELYDSECLLIDGMCGNYCYLGYVIKAEEDEYELTEDIVDLYLQPEWMETIKTAYPQVHDSIKNAGDYIKGVHGEILEAEERFTEEFKDLDNSKNSFLLSSPAMEVFSSIQENIETNIENLFATKKLIIDLYVELETNFPGVENDDSSEA
jgi:uncharacterized alkaline shock family protein YloU